MTDSTWKLSGSDDDGWEIWKDGGILVASVRWESDARVMFAARELLAIVKEHLADHLEACHITRRGDVCVLARQTQEIIAKAESAS